MKLAEALIIRADLQKRLEGLRSRLALSVLVQEGEEPPEDPRALLSEVTRLAQELEGLIPRINRTNLAVRLENGPTLTEALARRDMLALRHSLLDTAATGASDRQRRYGLSEIRQVATVNVGELRRELDALAQERRNLDAAIQAANWANDLLE